jgi:hypothetical protein
LHTQTNFFFESHPTSNSCGANYGTEGIPGKVIIPEYPGVIPEKIFIPEYLSYCSGQTSDSIERNIEKVNPLNKSYFLLIRSELKLNFLTQLKL